MIKLSISMLCDSNKAENISNAAFLCELAELIGQISDKASEASKVAKVPDVLNGPVSTAGEAPVITKPEEVSFSASQRTPMNALTSTMTPGESETDKRNKIHDLAVLIGYTSKHSTELSQLLKSMGVDSIVKLKTTQLDEAYRNMLNLAQSLGLAGN